jgi:hypothetical protein
MANLFVYLRDDTMVKNMSEVDVVTESEREEERRNSLEKFVLDYKSISSLETRLRGFNIFEAIGHVHSELRHSAFVAFLLDPQGTHGLNDFFLRRFIQISLDNDNSDNRTAEIIKFSTADLGSSSVMREYRNIDIIVVNDHEELVIVIENKIRSTEHSEQLLKYRKFTEETYPDHRKLFIYLTPDGEKPSDSNYKAMSYDIVADLIGEVLMERGSSISSPVKYALEHYLEILKRHVISDEELIRSAREVYQKHRIALDYIFEQRVDRQYEISQILIKLIEKSDELKEDNSIKSYVRFFPVQWNEIEAFKNCQEEVWTKTGRSLLFEFRNKSSNLSLTLVLGPTKDLRIREEIFRFCKSRVDIFGKTPNKFPPKYAALFSLPIFTQEYLHEDELVNLEGEIEKKMKSFLTSKLPRIQEALSKEFSNWNNPSPPGAVPNSVNVLEEIGSPGNSGQALPVNGDK